jgi:hypothetical protein
MQKWEYLQVHVESAKGKLTIMVNGNKVTDTKEIAEMADLMRYINSLGAEGWEIVNANRNEYGFQNYFFKRPVE